MSLSEHIQSLIDAAIPSSRSLYIAANSETLEMEVVIKHECVVAKEWLYSKYYYPSKLALTPL